MAVSLNPNGLTLGNTTIGDWADAGGGGDGYAVEVQVVAGGGGGSWYDTGAFVAGGGGGLVEATTLVAYGETVSVNIGGGGGGGTYQNNGGNGGNSAFRGNSIKAAGGGGAKINGNQFGSGGGCKTTLSADYVSAMRGFGCIGHRGRVNNGNDHKGGGGAGTEANGQGAGGAYVCFDGTSRAGGGNGSGNTTGGANTGRGGDGQANGKAGGSGVVIVRYPGNSAVGTGGTVSTSGGYVYHRFNSSGNFNAGNA